jgi:hypothetical protein
MVSPLSKPYTEFDLSNQLDSDFNWRIKEFSDLKSAIRASGPTSQSVLLRALVAMLYAHWEGYIRFCVEKYFSYITMRRHNFSELEAQIYVNHFIARIDAISTQRLSLHDRCKIIEDIMQSKHKRFSRVNQKLIDTRSNLNSKVLQELCLLCAVDFALFKAECDFIDRIVVKRRNEIAHGEETYIGLAEVDDLVSNVVKLMRSFRNSLENKIYQRSYLASLEQA